MKQDNNRLMGLIERSNGANQGAINGVEAQLGDVQAQQSTCKLHTELNTRIDDIQSQQSKLHAQLHDIKEMLSAVLHERR